MKYKTTLNREQVPAELLAELDSGKEVSDSFPDNDGKISNVVIRRERIDYDDGDYEHVIAVYEK